MVAWSVDPRTWRGDGRVGAAAVADSVCRLQCVAASLAGRGRGSGAATGVLAAEAGRDCGEPRSTDRLSAAERADVCRGASSVRAGCAADRATRAACRTTREHAV